MHTLSCDPRYYRCRGICVFHKKSSFTVSATKAVVVYRSNWAYSITSSEEPPWVAGRIVSLSQELRNLGITPRPTVGYSSH